MEFNSSGVATHGLMRLNPVRSAFRSGGQLNIGRIKVTHRNLTERARAVILKRTTEPTIKPHLSSHFAEHVLLFT